MKYSRVVNGIVAEVIDFDPNGAFTGEVAAQFALCGDDVKAGWLFDGAAYTPPPVHIPTAEEIAAQEKAAKDASNALLLVEILALQALALRALVEDTDTVWLDKRRAAIAVLRGQIAK